MDSIPGAIPPNKDVASTTTPPATITTPKGSATRWLSGIVFSTKMMTAAVSIQIRFIIPSATKPGHDPRAAAQAVAAVDHSRRRAPVAPGRQFRIRKNSGLLQRAWQMR